jgi:hypothetical protein
MELELLQQKIYEIRGQRVMLDFDLATLYEVDNKRLKEAVRRNIRRFPSDFMFELTSEEWNELRTQFATSKKGGTTRPPFAFTEQGVAMLSSVLNSEIAIEVNIAIMRAFVMMRQFALTYQELSEKLIELEKLHNQKFDDIEQVLKYLIQKDNQKTQQTTRKQVGYKK